jgi:hypothetical protein
MFVINSINVPNGYTAAMFGGVNANVGPISTGSLLGPLGAVYFVSVPGMGTLSLEDVGQQAGGWGVRVNNGPIWLYGGQNQGSIAVAADGTVTLSGGGVAPVQTKLIASMIDLGNLTQMMVKMAQRSPVLTANWNADAMATLYSMGYPRCCMINMDAECCRQAVALLQSLHLSAAAHEADDIDAFLAEHVDGWWGCTLCKANMYGLALTAFVAGIAALTAAGVTEAALLGILGEVTAIEEIAVAANTGRNAVAGMMVRAYLMGGAVSLVSSFVDGICVYTGACDAASHPEWADLANA